MGQKYPRIMHSLPSDKVNTFMIAKTTPNPLHSRALEGLLAGLVALRTSETRGSPITGTKRNCSTGKRTMDSFNATICGMRIFTTSVGRRLAIWFSRNRNRDNEPVLLPDRTDSRVSEWVENNREGILFYHGEEESPDHVITVSEAAEFLWHCLGTMCVEMEIGLFDKSKLPIAEEDYPQLNIKAGERFTSWGQANRAMKLGIFAREYNEKKWESNVTRTIAQLGELKNNGGVSDRKGRLIVTKSDHQNLYTKLRAIRENKEEKSNIYSMEYNAFARERLEKEGYGHLVNQEKYNEHQQCIICRDSESSQRRATFAKGLVGRIFGEDEGN